jgi:hypothetical protein
VRPPTERQGRPARRLRRGTVVALSVVASIWAIGGLAGAAPVSPPTVTLSTTTLVPGQTVMIEGTGWAHDTAFQAVLCGSDGNDGSNDCSVDAAATFVPFADGSLHGELQVVVPPVPCPCVVVVSGTNNDYTAKLPVTVVGAPTGTVTPPPVSEPSDVTATTSIRSTSSLGAIFGGAAGRELSVTLHNGGKFTVNSLVTARWGSSPTPANVIASPPPVTLAPGQTRTVTLPFTLDPLSFGSYDVVGQVSGTTPQLSFATTTSTWPWGIPVVLVAAVVLIVLWEVHRRRVRQRQEQAVDSFGPGFAKPGLGALAAMSVAGLGRGRDGKLRLGDVWLIGEVDGVVQTVPVAVLTMDSRGIGVTNPDTFELRVLTWESIKDVDVESWHGSTDTAAIPAVTGAVVQVDTTHTTYHFVVPNADVEALADRVGEIVRLWIRPPVKVPALTV